MFDNIMAVEEGFEPSVHLLHTVLAGQPFKPLKHSTMECPRMVGAWARIKKFKRLIILISLELERIQFSVYRVICLIIYEHI